MYLFIFMHPKSAIFVIMQNMVFKIAQEVVWPWHVQEILFI